MTDVFAGSRLDCLRGERLVFRELSFALAAGEALILTGPNGSGKSSLLRMMAGLLRPWHGHFSWNGQPVADDPEALRRRLAFVGHLDAVKPVLSAAENLAFWAGLADTPHPRQRALAALVRCGIAPVAETPGRYLSAGQKRRVNLARLLVTAAPVWLLDEPTVALDRAAVTLLEQVLAEHRAGGGMVVLSTHMPLDLPGAATLALHQFTPRGDDDGAQPWGAQPWGAPA